MIGLCNLGMERYEEALQQFKLYLKNFPDGDRVKEAETGVRISEERLGEKTPVQPVPSLPGKGAFGTVVESQAPEVKKSKRRVCAQVFYLEGRNLGEVEKSVKMLKDSGVDTLILKAFQNKGDRMHRFVTPRHEEGVYFRTEHAPVVDDILGKVTDIVHRNGLELFAWITTRYANYGSDGLPEYRGQGYNFETKRMEAARGFNLFHEDVLRRLEGLFQDLGRYPIDGILFQDDLILKHNEDFSPEAGKAFLKESGFPPHPDLFYIDPYRSGSGKYYVKAYTERFWTWAKWKNRSLMNIARRLMSAARQSNPNLQFGINLYYEAILNHSNALGWFSQTLSEAVKTGFDYYAIMAYHRQTMKELKMEEETAIRLMAEVARKAVQSIGDPSKVLMKVQILDWKNHEVLPEKEVEKVLDRFLDYGEVSLAFVPYIEQFPLQLLKGKWSKN
jgi:biofilm PGA synthesis lipoprotein PgaB